MNEEKKAILERILATEVEMFLSVPTAEEPSCRRHLEEMKLHRTGQFAGWSQATCASYLQDLERAKASGKNLMTLKYARLDDLVPPLSTNPRIAWIRERFVDWQRQVIADYPAVMRGARELEGFADYLQAELETYSDRTLELLAGDVEACQRAGGNMSLEVYRLLAERSGYRSLEAMEERFR
jgi:hypothetical protein